MSRRKGFTLIELLVVMSVIAILAAIAVPAIRGMQDNAKTSRVEGDLRVAKLALESYYNTNNAYPAAATWQTDLWNASPRVVDKKVYNDPFAAANTAYGYFRSADTKDYVAFSVGVGGSATITGISDAGVIQGAAGDDIFVSSGSF